MSMALAIVPRPAVVEFRRCTGHCCSDLFFQKSPGELRLAELQGRAYPRDQHLSELLVYQGWEPPSQGTEGHYYDCRALQPDGRCALHGTDKKPRMCTEYPGYGRSPWEVCSHDDCTRRTMVMEWGAPLRWRFPDLWNHDRQNRWHLFESRPCEATAAPECQDERYER